MNRPAAKEKRTPRRASRLDLRASGPSCSYLQTRVRASRLLSAARILLFIELSRRLHQAHRFAYDKQAADQLLPQQTEKDGIPPAQLSKCLQWLLAPYFKAVGEFKGLDLSDIVVHEGLPETGLAGLIVKGAAVQADAITLMHDIYIKPGLYGTNLDGIELVAHELTHVKQWYLHGQAGFAAEYLNQYRQNKKAGMDDDDAYRNISFEKEARDYAANIKEAIRNQYGESPCDKFKP